MPRRLLLAAVLVFSCSCWSSRPPTTVVEIVDEPPEDAVRVGYFLFNKCGDTAQLMGFAAKRGADFMVMHHFLGTNVCNVALFANH